MESVNYCVVCHAPIAKSSNGLVAPFLARRIWNRPSFSAKLMHCGACGFKFFNPRLDEDEEKRLYSGYRLNQYQRMRHLYEPWYTKSFNAGLSAPSGMKIRKDTLRRVLDPHLAGRCIRKVLDFGGNRGELIEDLIPNTERYVYDISDLNTLTGIGHLKGIEDCQQHQWDLVICSNVLEHVRDPEKTMKEIDKTASAGTLIFVEVPQESPSGRKNVTKRLVQLAILAVTRPSVARVLFRPALVYLMHEHVNFFSPRALRHLANSKHWEIIAEGQYEISSYKFGIYRATSGSMTWCLAKKP
ncbi:MAG: class I SAM-dependent methyltransferase [Acidobacteriaceae bacterium]